jgi:hypothetical protein
LTVPLKVKFPKEKTKYSFFKVIVFQHSRYKFLAQFVAIFVSIL